MVACHVGGRSATAAKALSDAGWTAENLTGGAVAWAAGEPDGVGTAPPGRGAEPGGNPSRWGWWGSNVQADPEDFGHHGVRGILRRGYSPLGREELYNVLSTR